jgi:hypothetical protein
MQQPCHLEPLGTGEGKRDTLADPEEVSVWSPKPPDKGKTVFMLRK